MERINKTIDKFLKQLKPVLNFNEACEYCGISPSSMYKHTAAKRITHYKPEGKLIYFKREELDEWMLKNRQSTMDEMQEKAIAISYNQKRKY